MPDLDALGVTRETVKRMYEEWKGGAAKSELERRYLGKGESHGKLFTALVKQELGIDTEQPSALREQIERLREENVRLRTENEELRRKLGFERGGQQP